MIINDLFTNKKTKVSEGMAGKVVLYWPVKDKSGWEYADRASQAILMAGARTCHILYPPEDAPEGHVVRVLLQQFADEVDNDGGEDGELVGHEVKDGADEVAL